MPQKTIALVGNPNCGKTALFNALTGSHQRVGNWPGVTVERMEGEYRFNETLYRVVDLPGIYSFSAFSIDESVACRYILENNPDLVINIIDATNLERNLYLTAQLLEMKAPMLVALNMMDLAQQRRLHIELAHFATHLDCPVVPTTASRKEGLNELRQTISEHIRKEPRPVPKTEVTYLPEIEKVLCEISQDCTQVASEHGVNPRWLAVKLLEGDQLAAEIAGDAHAERVQKAREQLQHQAGEDADILIADGRYGFIHGLTRDVLRRDFLVRQTVTDVIDRVVLNRALGIPIFLAVMYLIFSITINVGKPFIDFFDLLCGTIFVDGFGVLLSSLGVPDVLRALLADGIGGGIQTVATFIPPIFLIFLCLSLLEDSGYMARAAFVMDRVLRVIGLPGKAFLPMLVGFGCNVPGILATRTLENEQDRVVSIMMNPFMSCGARLPVYTLFAVAFFPTHGSLVVFGLYITGIAMGVLTGLLLRKTVMDGETSTFVMELPPYHIPTVSGILRHTWHRLSSFIVRAGKVIIGMVVILSLLNGIDTNGTFRKTGSTRSLLSEVARFATPLFAPMGIERDNWPAVVGLFTGIFAKETVIGTLDTLYSQLDAAESGARKLAGNANFSLFKGIKQALAAIPAGFRRTPAGKGQNSLGISRTAFSTMRRYFRTGAAAFAYLLFILLYSPCVATVAAIMREVNLRWTIFEVSYLSGLAWISATLFYQASTFLQHPASSSFWLAGCVGGLLIFCAALYRWGYLLRSSLSSAANHHQNNSGSSCSCS